VMMTRRYGMVNVLLSTIFFQHYCHTISQFFL
jgi:hypothetical protein